MRFQIQILSPDDAEQTIELDGPLEVGREAGTVDDETSVVIDDPAVSRRHLALAPDGDGVVVTDLGSANGTTLDGRPVHGAVTAGDGGIIAIGDSTLTVRAMDPEPAKPAKTAGPAQPSPPATMAPSVAARPAVSAAAPVRPAPSSASSNAVEVTGGLVTVRATTGTVGADAVGSVHDLAVRARKALVGLGSEPWGTPVTITLVDPFPDPTDADRVVTVGSVIDVDNSTVSMVVTAESPPEDPHRPLALLFGAALPGAADVDHLLEGYGLHLAGTPDPEPDDVADLAGSIESLDPAQRGPMAASFVAFLIAREGRDAFRTLLAAPSGRLAEAWREGYGRSATALEAQWQAEAAKEPSDVGVVDFMKLSWRYLRPYRVAQAEVFAWMLFSLAFTVTNPFVTRAIFDDAIPGGDFGLVLTLLGILTGAFVVSLAAGLRQEYRSAWISGSVVRDLRQELFGRLQRVPDAWTGRHPQGDVLSRMMNDVGRVQAGLSTAINDGIFQVISLVVATAIMLKVNLLLGAIVLIGAPVVALVYRTMSAGARTRSLAVQEESSAVLSVAAENYQSAAVVRLFRLAGHEERRFGRASDRLFRAQQRMSLFGGFFGLAVESVTTTLRLVILGLGTWLIFEGHFTLGGLVAFIGLMGQVLAPVTGLTSLGQSIQSSVGALIRVEEVLDAEVEPDGDDLPALAPVAADIRFDQVSLSYSPESRALDGVDVTITAGTRVAFVGPSGSGKSTILKVLMRLYEPDAGAVLVDGVDVAKRSLDSLRGQMGVVFQDSFLFDATVRENIALGSPGATDAQVLAAADAAEVDAFVDDLPRGIESLVGEGGRNLSGGQRQRVAIARALVGDPAVLLLDEATSALDPRTERQIADTLARVGAGRTVISVTHRLTSVVDYDKVFVVDRGVVVEQGSHDELVAMGGVYARLWGEQTGAEVPPAPPLDLSAVLAKLPLFADLDPTARAEVADRFEPMVVEAGETFAEGGERLLVLADGQGEVLALADSSQVRRLGRGDVFGLNAVMGEPTGTALRATERSTLLVLDGDALAELRSAHSSIAEGQAGRATLAAAPAGRLVRPTIGPGGLGGGGATTQGLTAAEVAAAVAEARTQSRAAKQTVGAS